MNRRLPAALAAVLLFTFTLTSPAAPREAEWKKVDEAIQKGLPQTAIQELDPIIAAATKDKAWPEVARAVTRRITLEGNIQGNKPEEKISRLEAEIAKAPAELKPLLTTVLAHWYWHYFQQNRWRFMQRTATAEAPGKDFTTWDLPRLFAEIDKVYSRALADADALKRTPVAAFDGFLEKGALADAHRPTLYDFIAREALEFYSSGEQAAAKPEDAFEISVDSPAFAEAAQFAAWTPAATDTNSPVFEALRLHQELLKFHAKDADSTALLDADLSRLVWAKNMVVGDEKTARFEKAMSAFADRHAAHPLSARALHEWARSLQVAGKLVEAHALARRGAQAHPNSPGGKLCKNLVTEIEAKSASATVERVWNAPLPKITVRYRNVTEVHFRAVKWDWNDFLQKNHSRPEWLNDGERAELMRRAPALSWSAKLPATTNFAERVERIAVPQELPKGHYFLVASHRADFGDDNNQVSYADFWVSDLALIVRTRDGAVEGFVLNAISGEPLAGAEVASWYLNNQGQRIAHGTVQTDAEGVFKFAPAPQNRSLLVRARFNGDEIGSQGEFNSWQQGRSQPYSSTMFFTDRSIYRPGQTVHYKGICYRVEQAKDDYHALAGENVTVVFSDPNGKEIARAQHRANDFGSFSGSFTAPRDRLMGRMSIRVQGAGQPGGATAFNVEEYKRPKFEVTLDAPKTAPKLDSAVSLQGKAEAYTGAAVDAATVKWRVVREVRFPIWCWWGWRSFRNQGSQEIAHGAARTANDGTFKIEFTALPDRSVAVTNEPTFHFTIHADVTDANGETRSASRSVSVGYTALQASVTADAWLTDEKPVELRLKTTTLDGEGQRAEGKLRIHRLQEPAKVQRAGLAQSVRWRGRWNAPVEDDAGDDNDDEEHFKLAEPQHWKTGALVVEKNFATDAAGDAKTNFNLGPGAYRVLVETQDRFGKRVTARQDLIVLQPKADKLALKVPNLVSAPTFKVEPGGEFTLLWGTGYDAGRAFVEVIHRGKSLQRFWTAPGRTQVIVKQAVDETMRGGFTVSVTQVRENRAYLSTHHVDVPWSNKEFELKWEHFTSKLQPGQKETWTLVVKPRVGGMEKFAAELAATLYDASLDAYLPHHWPGGFGVFRNDYSYWQATFENNLRQLQHMRGNWPVNYENVELTYRHFPHELVQNFWGYAWGFGGRARGGVMMMKSAAAPEGLGFAPAPEAAAPAEMAANGAMLRRGMDAADKLADREEKQVKRKADEAGKGEGGGASPKPNLDGVTARKNLQETAFFFPRLLAGADGSVKLEFAMPEALTKWRFFGFAHDAQLRAGSLSAETVTAKDIMVVPNPPRFLREGDTLEFTVKVANQSAARQTGKVRLTFADAFTGAGADKLLGNTKAELDFDIPAKESRAFAWRVQVPDGCPFLTFNAVAATGRFSDGEEGSVPVLARRIFVTESLPLPIRGAGVKQFEFKKLLDAGKSRTLRHEGYTVQMVSQPAWYAVLALPYLMEHPHECSDAVFTRLYANALARHIANSDPKIRRVFDQWRGTPALDSPLEKNVDLKSVALEETPWLRQAKNESEARRNVGVLFDANRLNDETARTLKKLSDAQLPDGLWAWFPGGRGNEFITLYITTGFGRLRHLGANVPVDSAMKSLARLDQWVDEQYREILKHGKKDENHLGSTICYYLYGRSFFLKDKPLAAPHKEAFDYFTGQAKKYWLSQSRQSQGHLALALHRLGEREAALGIVRSLKERSVTSEELGRFWRDAELSWWWYHAPIETQALMIEAFDEVAGDAQAVEDCRVWLLKQKQTQDWKTTKATADAVYALILRGANWLASDALVEITVGGKSVLAEKKKLNPKTETPVPQIEAGTGFYEHKYRGNEVEARMGKITLKKTDAGVSWGSVHWQYFEDMSKVTPHTGTPLTLKKSLYTKVNTKRGLVLEPVKNGAVKVGDELVVRLELRVDRDCEFVHLKDQRGSGTEPVNVLSRYKYQDGLGYYETTRDTAGHFFMDYMPKGAYVFEYSTRVQHRGVYQTGLATIQCLYAPEFNSHSESVTLNVK